MTNSLERGTGNGSRRGEVVVAIIGLIGVLLTGVLSNWDKLFTDHDSIQVRYAGYRPTGNFETELRYFFEVSGTRAQIDLLDRQQLQHTEQFLLSKFPERSDEIRRTANAMRQEVVRYDDAFREFLPIYQKHFTIDEIQELNKFYSSDLMQGMLKKMPLVAIDAAAVNERLMAEYVRRVEARLGIKPEAQ